MVSCVMTDGRQMTMVEVKEMNHDPFKVPQCVSRVKVGPGDEDGQTEKANKQTNTCDQGHGISHHSQERSTMILSLFTAVTQLQCDGDIKTYLRNYGLQCSNSFSGSCTDEFSIC